MAADASKYDLTSELGKYLDRHLVFPLLEFLQAKKVYPEAEILEAKIALLQKTNMLDFAADIYKSLHNGKDVPAEMAKRREEVIANLTELQAKAEKVVTFLSDPALVKQLRTTRLSTSTFSKRTTRSARRTSTPSSTTPNSSSSAATTPPPRSSCTTTAASAPTARRAEARSGVNSPRTFFNRTGTPRWRT